MSAGVCGKRVGFEELFGSSSSPPSCSAAKRTRRSGFGSPTRSSKCRSGSEDSLSVLIQMFPALDPELVENVLKIHKNKIEDAVESLRAVSFDVIARNKSQSLDSATIGNCAAITGSQMSDQKVEVVTDLNSTFDIGNKIDVSKWVDLFLHEMMNATDLDDTRGRAARTLEAFEKSITVHSRAPEELEHASLKEHLQNLLHNNQILKRAVSIQHERNLEQEEKTREVQQIKHVLSQNEEQVRNLELSNYTLKLHLQRARDNCFIPGQFHPDIY